MSQPAAPETSAWRMAGRSAARLSLLTVAAVLCSLTTVVALDMLRSAAAPARGVLVAIAAAIIFVAGLACGRLAGTVGNHRSAPAPDPEMESLRRRAIAAEAANAAKSRFLASISHEIRSPLNSIYGFAQLLERGGERDPVAAAGIIRRSAEHLTHLVDGLLDMSQVENGVMKLNREVIPLAPFLDQVAGMFRHSAAAAGLTFRYDRPDRLPRLVRMDEARLRQVLINLLSNAIKYTRNGTVGFRITYAGQMATFEISDTGPGIAADRQQTVFDPFERGDAPGEHVPGAGLGLAITQALVRVMGGNLEMESDLGVGTTVRVTMMLGNVAGEIGRAPVAKIGGYEGPRRSILVADDDVHHLSLATSLLERLGFDVATASRGDAALQIAHDRTFDLVLLDIAMPGLDGWETAARLRREHGPNLRILILSGNAIESEGRARTPAVHDGFLKKPVDLDKLMAAIGAALALRWIPAPAGAPTAVLEAAAERPAPLPEGARVHLRSIRDLLRIGHARGIEREIKALEQTMPEAQALVAHLYGLLDRYDFAGLDAVIGRHL